MMSPAGALRSIVLCLALGLAWLMAGNPPATAQTAQTAQQGLVSFTRDGLILKTADGVERALEIELALSPQQQAQGLMYRQRLAADAGMLFVYRPARLVTMWMKNTEIPLDMLFIAEDGEIVKVVERTVPFSLTNISSDRQVRAVLEINGGMASRLGIRPGDRVVHPVFGTGP